MIDLIGSGLGLLFILGSEVEDILINEVVSIPVYRSVGWVHTSP